MTEAENPMKAYIDKELKARSEGEIKELLLDNCKSKEVVGLKGHKFENVNHISFIGCGLESLEGLEKLPEVRVLDLSENKLTSLEKIPECFPKLYHLNICDNPLKSIDQLKPLAKLENLQALDIFDCPITEIEDHRKQVFEAIPSLKFLNGFDINDEEADDLGTEGESSDEMGEHGFEDGESDMEDTEEEIGLDYLQDSELVSKDDTSEDYNPEAKANGKASQKRKPDADAGGDAPPEKKKAEEETS